MEEAERGWYPDPADPAILRWWDGIAWSEQTRPGDADSAAPLATAMALSHLVASVDGSSPLANAAPVEPPPGSGAWGATALGGGGTAVLRPPAPSQSPAIPPTGPPPSRRPRSGKDRTRRVRPTIVFVVVLLLISAGTGVFLLVRSSDEDRAVDALQAESSTVGTPSGRLTIELPGECIGITTAELSAPGGQWGGLAAAVGAQAIACGTGEEGGRGVVNAFAEEGTGRLPPVAVLTLDRIGALAPGVDAATTAELLARQFAEMDEAGAEGSDDRALYTVERVDLGPSERGTAAGFESRGPSGPRALRTGQVQFIGDTVIVVIVSAPAGQEALAGRVLERAVASIRVS